MAAALAVTRGYRLATGAPFQLGFLSSLCAKQYFWEYVNPLVKLIQF
jgi:hypothetical protein